MNYELLNELNSLHGDSFYLLDSSKFEDNYDEFLLAFKKYYSKTNIGYSYKTNYTPPENCILQKIYRFVRAIYNYIFRFYR